MEEFEQDALAQGIRVYHSDRFLAKKMKLINLYGFLLPLQRHMRN